MRPRAVSATATKEVKRSWFCWCAGPGADAVCDADKGFQLLTGQHVEHVFGHAMFNDSLRLAERVLNDEHEDRVRAAEAIQLPHPLRQFGLGLGRLQLGFAPRDEVPAPCLGSAAGP